MAAFTLQGRLLPALRVLGLTVLPLALEACTNGQLEPQHQAVAASVLQYVASAPANVAHEGVRLVEYFGAVASGGYLAHRERVQTDGQGRFSLVPLEALSPGLLDEFSYMAQLVAQEGYNFRYRDFRILSADLLLANYLITSYGVKTQVAGRDCHQIELERRTIAGDPPERSYVIDLDVQTSLVLSTQEYSSAGQLLSRSIYESFSLGLPASMVPHVLANGEQVLPLGPELDAAVGFTVKAPTYVPPGFELLGSSKVVDGQNQVWAKLFYTDGIEKLFVLVRAAMAPAFPKSGGLTGGQGSSTGGVPSIDSAGFSPGHLRHMSLGGLQVMQGWINDWQVIGVGRIPQDDLHAMLESTLP